MPKQPRGLFYVNFPLQLKVGVNWSTFPNFPFCFLIIADEKDHPWPSHSTYRPVFFFSPTWSRIIWSSVSCTVLHVSHHYHRLFADSIRSKLHQLWAIFLAFSPLDEPIIVYQGVWPCSVSSDSKSRVWNVSFGVSCCSPTPPHHWRNLKAYYLVQ